jgi:predicted RNase H-like HicB family nuclease
MRQVMVYRGEDGFWVAECPSLPGCVSQGETQESALANVKEAIQAYIGALRADSLPVAEDHLDARLVTV